MAQKIIEPSEILTGEKHSGGRTAKVEPTVRFIARLFDYSLFCLSLLILKFSFSWHFSENFFETMIPFEFFCWIPIETLFLWLWGKTPGKWFLNLELRFDSRKKPDFLIALRRSVSVWFRGLGMGIPVINVLCMLVAYQRLKMTQSTTWDNDDRIHVYQYPLPKWRFIAAVIFSTLGLFLYFFLKNS